MMFAHLRYCVLTALLLLTVISNAHSADDKPKLQMEFAKEVLADKPVAYWRMNESASAKQVRNEAANTDAPARRIGSIKFGQAGPASPEHKLFKSENLAISVSGANQYLAIKDKDDSPFDFDNGDTITIEAMVKPGTKMNGSYPYIIGKGRTHNPGFSQLNQNWALRLDPKSGQAKLSFLFFEQPVAGKTINTETHGHRWTSKNSFPIDGYWHHVAITYTFGKPDSAVGFIDGKKTDGVWDLGGKTTNAPVVDNDDVWIGASMGGSNAFDGSIDEVAIYRTAVPAKRLTSRYAFESKDELIAAVKSIQKTAPTGHVQIDVLDSFSDSRNWKIFPKNRTDTYKTDVFALTELPRKYNSKAIIADRPVPFLIHAYSCITLPKGTHQLVLRSLNASRLYVDDKLLAENPFMNVSTNAHQPVHILKTPKPGQLSLPLAHFEKEITFESDGKPHVYSLLAIIGHKGRAAEIGELMLAVGPSDDSTAYSILGPELNRPFNDAGWLAHLKDDAHRRHDMEKDLRRTADANERKYWQQRHDFAREYLAAQKPPVLPVPKSINKSEAQNLNPIDRFILNKLEAVGLKPVPPIDDYSFLRRTTLDTIGQNPTLAQINSFIEDDSRDRRTRYIEQLLKHEGWADHWVGYWQDVLAENPGLTKPNLNNSGPFRWYLYEAFLDNRPMDRLVSELIMMEGSKNSGGTAGFGIASNNDVPMAAKAHILGTAFLGVEMKCSRCHDSPTHQNKQEDLFNLAAMLNRNPVAVPKSSSIPATPEELAEMVVKVSLKPGSKVQPVWPFENLNNIELDSAKNGLLRNPTDSRERLALRMTHPANERFAKVLVNRVWERYMGRGLIELVHDWEGVESSHPELLDYLAYEFMTSGYDLKHLAKLILTSDAYQRQSIPMQDEQAEELYATSTRRRLTAEQIVDSAYVAAGKQLETEELNMNADGKNFTKTFINLGQPKRAWELVSTSNERERPSMSLPKAQSIVDLMMAYGWRQNRQEPVSNRVDDPTPLQPMVLANGMAISRIVDLSDNGDIVELCLKDCTTEELIDTLYLRFLTRRPTTEEKQEFSELLSPGFENRIVDDAKKQQQKVDRSPLAWTNHLDAKANEIGIARQNKARKGDPPTQRLTPKWRERAEDAVWVLVNHPEFVFVP